MPSSVIDPLPPAAGDFAWPDPGFTATEPARDGNASFTITQSRISFPNFVTFLAVNPAIVVLAACGPCDPELRRHIQNSAEKASALLLEKGLFVVTPYDNEPVILTGSAEDDQANATRLLREFIIEGITRRDVNAVRALGAYTYTMALDELAEFLGDVTNACTALSERIAADGIPAGDKAHRAFGKAFGEWLDYMNGNFERIPIPRPLKLFLRAHRQARRRINYTLPRRRTKRP